MLNSLLRTTLVTVFFLSATNAISHSSNEKSSIGEPANETKANKIIKVIALDTMRFSFSEKPLPQDGEVITFEIKNAGKVAHEFSIGDEEEQKAHQKMMQSMPNMVHEDANTITVKPGETKNLTWRFRANQGHDVIFSCNIPGHFEAGMYEKVKVVVSKP
ncbi:Uncharacterized copper-binding protein (plasmid) [Legionella adelaidensis]|uniref:Uncharacterized copper-binding protein n=1 Tax=Legionella adelaidensis TaxID=45056 RepID=A0A0W0R5T4_9GAMM|nr:multicopper oxidase domain-containing protein [Legionella adelaidensis]KTC66394.1 hypothetical protein Lade_1052 [Legionella adelaidensis]VEH84992.1 Uncharacterized copper-binding protein [Legionella adelaidensis]